MERCQNHMAPQSQNVMEKCMCGRAGVDRNTNSNPTNWIPEDDYVDLNLNQAACEAQDDAEWVCFKWGGDHTPECVDSYWTKVNYLGNADGTTRGGKQAHYDWKLPSWNSLVNDHYCYPYGYEIDQSADTDLDSGSDDVDCVRMVFRIRYNMSTMEYDPFTTNSTHDYAPDDGILSPIEQNPEVDVGFYVQGLQLAINTAQTGRTFQDRSHTFLVCKRDSSGEWVNKPLLNVNVRGKRGKLYKHSLPRN